MPLQMNRFTVVHTAELARHTDDLSWQARGLFLELLLAADYATGMVPATSREQVRVWTGRSWSATANHLDELGKAGLIVESAAGIEVTVYPQISDPRGNREQLRAHREQLALTAKSLAPTAKPTSKNAPTITNTRTTADGDRWIDGQGWV
jgi:hypothetical protein|tara:strand:- start:1405 stop:1854 length:450 start_codon:yes stop_codon:yes gene_type:complete